MRELPTFTGTEVGYYFICVKKLWWFAHGVTMEHENDRVRMGKLVHGESYARRKKELNIDDRIVLDWREDGVIHEVKLTDSMERAHEMQLLYYLYYLKLKGVEGLRDLAEVFKPILADRLLFKLLNNRQLSDRDFAQDLNCCYLKESGRKVVLKEWDARLQTTIEHRRLRRKVSYERLIRLECYKLVKHLTNVEPYAGFRAWW